MLESLIIRNFQCHERLSIEFDPFVTCIVGESDRGKSAVIRALRWLCINRPVGDSFVRYGSKFTKVLLQLDEGCRISRVRGKGKNHYLWEGKSLQSFGQGVPEEVSSALNLGEVTYQQQHDPPFWFTLSPGEVSRELNAIVNLGAIDSALSYLASELRKAKTTVEVSESRLKEAQARKRELKWVVSASRELAAIEELEQEAEELEAKIASLESLLEEAKRAEEGQKTLGRMSREGKAIITTGEQALTAQDKVVRLESLLEKIKATEEELCQLRKSITTLESGLKKKLGNQCPLCGNLLNTSQCSHLTSISASDLR